MNVSDVADDIKATAASIVSDAADLQALETAKAQLPAEDPVMPALAAEAERVADTILRKTRMERLLVDKVEGV
jgi:hypothetical protein